MAIKKVDKKSKKEVDYVASGLDIKYSIPVGLVPLLARASNMTEKEVWCTISNIGNICAARLLVKLDKKQSYPSSWTNQDFPGSGVKIRVDMSGRQYERRYDYELKQYVDLNPPQRTFYCKIKISGNATETYTQAKIDEYITSTMEESLLGLLDGDENEELSTIADETNS